MTQYSVWSPYTGTASIILAIAMVAVAIVLALVGWRLRRPVAGRSAGPATGVFLVVLWFLSVLVLDWATLTYGKAINDQVGAQSQPTNPITRFTVGFAIIAFVCIAILTRRYGWKIAVISGVAGAGAGPVMFELPFDWIIMFRLQVPDPVSLYRWLYFLPLFSFIVITLALLTLSPAARLRRQTLFALAGMFLVWAVWALFGFAYPDQPLTIVLNVVSKLLAAVAGVMLFLPDPAADLTEEIDGG